MPADPTRRMMAVVCIVFLAAGLSSSAIGPLMQELAVQADTDVVSAGGIVTAIFATSLLAQIAVAMLQKRVGHRRIMLGGMILSILGVTGIVLAGSLPMLLIAAAVKGLGDSGMLLVGNVVAAEASTGAGPLNLVNGMFGVGAILSPALVSLSILHLGGGVPALWASPLAAGLAFVLLLWWHPAPAVHAAPSGQASLAVLRTGMIWKVTLFVLMEVAVEVGISSWMPVMLTGATSLTLPEAAIVMSVYWFLVTAARFGAVWASRYLTPLRLLTMALMLCLTGALLLVAGLAFGHAWLAVLAVGLMGVAIGPLLPTSLSILRAAYPRDAGFATGVAFGSSNLGAAVVPAIMGALIVTMGPAIGAASLFVPMGCLVLALVMIWLEIRGWDGPAAPATAGP